MIFYLVLHFLGVSCTAVVLQRCKFDTDLKCEMVARNIWSGMYTASCSRGAESNFKRNASNTPSWGTWRATSSDATNAPIQVK